MEGQPSPASVAASPLMGSEALMVSEVLFTKSPPLASNSLAIMLLTLVRTRDTETFLSSTGSQIKGGGTNRGTMTW